ncbi:MAG: hypothetical protein WBP59_03890 [Ilumatobacteraceae bacterium]
MTNTPASNDPSGPARPAWVIPVIVGIVAITAIALALIFTRDSGDSDESTVTDSTVGATTTDASTTASTEPTEPTVTTPDATDPPATDPPATDAPAPDGPLADDVSTLAADELSIASANGTSMNNIVSTCHVTVAPGLQLTSSGVSGAAGSEGAIMTLDIWSDEGSTPYIEISDLSGQVGGFIFGRDGGDGDQVRWGAELTEPFGPVNQLTLESTGAPTYGDGTPVAPINISFTRAEAQQCGSGFYIEPSPFAPGETPAFLDQFGEQPGTGFAIVGQCSDTLILSGGGMLSAYDFDGAIQVNMQLAPAAETDYYTTPDPVDPAEQIVDQQGGGGDVSTALRVDDFDTGTPTYLTWTQQPPVEGGMPTIECG